MKQTLTVNGKRVTVDVPEQTPLLYVLRDHLRLDGPLFGCGMAQCGTCAVLLEKNEIRSCMMPVGAIASRPITTLEGLADLWAHESGDAATLHPVQQAWIDEQVPQCGYCQNGMIVQAVDLLGKNYNPSDDEIRQAMDGHLCRCGTHLRIVRAIKRAAARMSRRDD